MSESSAQSVARRAAEAAPALPAPRCEPARRIGPAADCTPPDPRTTALLDAIPAHALVIDEHGIILAVNRSWRQFADASGLMLPDDGVGSSYLALCAASTEEGAPQGRAIAEGIGDVLRGRTDSFTLEYACPWEPSRWYDLRANPIRSAAADPARVLLVHEEITDRKHAEFELLRSREQLEHRVAERTAELRRSEELHRHIVESLPGGVIHIASDGSFAGANAEGLQFLGLSLEDLRRRLMPDFAGQTFHEDGSPCPVEDYPASQCLATGLPQPPQTIGLRRADGQIVWAVFTAVPVDCPVHPGRTAAVVTFLDITQRKRADDAIRRSEEALRQAHERLEQRVIERTAELAQTNQVLREQITERNRADAALRDSEERFRQMAENIREVVWIVDADTRAMLYVSPAYEQIWGRSRQSLHSDSRSFLRSVLPEDVAIAVESLEHQRYEPYDCVYRIRDGEGRLRWIRSRTTPIRDDAGRVRRITGIAEDITDLKLAEQELARLASIVESSNDAIIGIGLDCKILSWNCGAQRIYGYTAAETVGRDCSMLVPPEHGDAMAALLRRVGAGERIDSFETVRTRRDGSRFHVSLTISSVVDSAGNIIAASGIERDITDRKRLEQEILHISERERRRIGQDLHDGLGQHLTGIGFMSKSLQQRLATKAAAARPATADEAAEAGQIAELVQQAIGQTRALARGLHPVEPTRTGLMAALQELAARSEQIFKVECAFECDQPVMVADNVLATHLYRIAQEAVNNAVKHAAPRSIRISLGCGAGGDRGDSGNGAGRERLVLSITDDGIGMPCMREAGGAAGATGGLGLRIMQYRAKMIGGRLTIDRGTNVEPRHPSRLGRGPGTVVRCEVSRGCPRAGAAVDVGDQENAQ